MKLEKSLLLVLYVLLAVACGCGTEEPKVSQDADFTNSIGMKFKLIPAGEFMMGSPKDEEERGRVETQHRVRITEPYYLGVHEVTQSEYERVMGKNPSHFRDEKLPVERVTWNDAVEFCRKLSAKEGREHRLPTEAEWEYACRAGTTAPFHFGRILNGAQANCNGNYPYGTGTKGPYLGRTTTVCSYTANAWGLHDMHGNVWEFCSDWYRVNYYERLPTDDPTSVSVGSSRVFRGGSWTNIPRLCRSVDRLICSPGYRNDDLGFRVALDPAE